MKQPEDNRTPDLLEGPCPVCASRSVTYCQQHGHRKPPDDALAEACALLRRWLRMHERISDGTYGVEEFYLRADTFKLLNRRGQ